MSSSLGKAIIEDDLLSVNQLASNAGGVDIGNSIVFDELNPLQLAVVAGRFKIVKRLLDDSKFIDSVCKNYKFHNKTYERCTSLHLCCIRGNDEICELLLSQGANCELKTDCDGFTPLHLAVIEEYPKVVKLLIKYHPNCVNRLDYQDSSAVHYTIDNKTTEILKLLIENGAYLELVDKKGMSVLHKACLKGRAVITQMILKQRKSILNFRDGQGRTALHCAVKEGHTNVVKILLNALQIADVFKEHRAHSYPRRSLLKRTSQSVQQDNIFNQLLNCREQVEIPLSILACSRCSAKIARLKETAADVNLVNNQQLTALNLSVMYNDLPTTQLLLRHGAEVKNDYYKQPLYNATSCGFSEVVEELLKCGFKADSHTINKAVTKDLVDVFKNFVDQGWELSSEELLTLIRNVIASNNVDIIQLLFSSGINITYQGDIHKDSRLPTKVDYFVRYCVSWIDGYVPHCVNAGPGNECVIGFCESNNDEVSIVERWFLNRFPRIHTGSTFIMHDIFSDCLKEVEIMKQRRLGITDFTLFDLLQKQFKEQVKCFKNKELIEAFSKIYHFNEFPICKDILRTTFDKCLKRRLLLDQCVKWFPCAFSLNPKLPLYIIEEIFNKLPNRDLNAFNFACNDLI